MEVNSNVTRNTFNRNESIEVTNQNRTVLKVTIIIVRARANKYKIRNCRHVRPTYLQRTHGANRRAKETCDYFAQRFERPYAVLGDRNKRQEKKKKKRIFQNSFSNAFENSACTKK